MREKNITRVTLEQARKLKGRTDWDRLRSMTEEELERAIADDPDWDGTDDIDWSKAVMMPPKIKKAVSIRLDQDILDFFKAAGRGYQTRINTILRSYMEAQKSR